MYGFVFSLLFLGTSAAMASSAVFQQAAKDELLQHGKKAYERRCAGCHGVKGDGKGDAAIFLNPRPRDFTKGVFKFRSGNPGTLPTDQDLMETITKGIPNSSMPGFDEVPEKERYAVVQYIKVFAPEVWSNKENFGPAVVGADLPTEDFTQHKKFIERATRGRKIFAEACVVCHGLQGKGDGVSGADLEDDWGNKIVPANLTKKTIKRGKSIKDIYKTLLTGVNGTPMVSFKGSYTDDQLWDVTAWVLYLRGVKAGIYGETLPIAHITQQEADTAQQ